MSYAIRLSQLGGTDGGCQFAAIRQYWFTWTLLRTHDVVPILLHVQVESRLPVAHQSSKDFDQVLLDSHVEPVAANTSLQDPTQMIIV